MFALIQPPANGLVSGGYLYNRAVGAPSEFVTSEAPVSTLSATLAQLPPNTEAAIFDGLYFDDPQAIDEVERFTSCTKIALVHYLPPEVSGITRNEQRRRTRLLVRALNATDAVITTSHYVSRYLQRLAQWPVPIGVVPPGVSNLVTRYRRRRTWPPRRMLTVAAVTHAKGQRIALEALNRIPRKTWCWDIIGDTRVEPEYVASFVRRVHRLGFEDRISILGSRSQDEVARRLDQADLFLFPSQNEAYGIACAEAVASALPAVAFRVGGLGEVVRHGENGMLCSLSGVSSFARTLGLCLTRRSVYESLARSTFVSPSVRLWDECRDDFGLRLRELISACETQETGR